MNWDMDGIRDSGFQGHCSRVSSSTWWLQSKFTEYRLLSYPLPRDKEWPWIRARAVGLSTCSPSSWLRPEFKYETWPFLTQLVWRENMYIAMTVQYIPYSSPTRCLHDGERGHSRDGKGREGLLDSVGGFRIRPLSYLRTLPFPLAFSSATSIIALVIRVHTWLPYIRSYMAIIHMYINKNFFLSLKKR